MTNIEYKYCIRCAILAIRETVSLKRNAFTISRPTVVSYALQSRVSSNSIEYNPDIKETTNQKAFSVQT